MPAQLKVLGVCALILAVFGGGLYVAVSQDASLQVSSRTLVEGTVIELERIEGMDLKFSGGRGRAGLNAGKMPGSWVAIVELQNGEVIRVQAGNPPVRVGDVVEVNLATFESGGLAGSLATQYTH